MRICINCGADISHKNIRAIYCCKRCKDTSTEKKEKDRQRYLSKHPGARTQKEICSIAAIKRAEKLNNSIEYKKTMEARRKQREKERLDNKNKMYNIVCKVCNQTFKSKYTYAKYCSDVCRKIEHPTNHRTRKRYKGITIDSNISLFKLAERDNNQCQICGLLVDWNDKDITERAIVCGAMYPSIDHIKPISKGGLHSWENIQLAHRKCNCIKHDKEF